MMQSLTLVEPHFVGASYQPIARSTPLPAKVDTAPVIVEVDPLEEQQKELQQAIDKFAASKNGEYGIHVSSLNNEVAATHQEDKQLYSASLYKLFAAQMAYQRVDAGEWSLSQPMVGGQTLEQCLNAMITVSDNACGVDILLKLGLSSVNSTSMTKLGYPSTNLSGTYTKSSAKDVAKLLRDLEEGNILSKSSRQAFLDLLAAQKINDRLPQGLPDGVQIAHKTGDLVGYVHDAGIVRSVDGSSYIIVVMSGPDPSIPNYAQRYTPFAAISKTVYEIMSSDLRNY